MTYLPFDVKKPTINQSSFIYFLFFLFSSKYWTTVITSIIRTLAEDTYLWRSR